MSEQRDRELGEALRGLGRPEHEEGFFSRLWTPADRTEEDRAAADSAGEEAAPTRPETTDVEPAAVQRPASWWAHPRVLFAGIAAAVAVVVAVLLFGVPGVQTTAPGEASAAEVLAIMDRSGQTPMTVTADLVSTYYGQEGGAATLTLRRHVVADTLGDWMRTLTADDDPEPAVEGTLFDARRLQSGEWRAPMDWDGVSEVPGVLYAHVPASHGILAHYNELTTVSLVRALLVGSDATAHSVTYLGRDAWRLQLDVPETGHELRHPDRIELTIDAATGYPLETVDWRGDTKDAEQKVVSITVEPGTVQEKSAEFEAAQHAIVNPYDDPMTRQADDFGCRHAPLGRFVDLIGRPAIVAGWTPDGFSLADATAKTGVGYSNDPETSVVYRGGLWAFAVDSFKAEEVGVDGDPMQWSDLAAEETVKLRRGLFRGCEAHIVMNARARYSASHLWVRDEKTGIVVAVLGDLSRDEFVAVAESLQEGPK
jgi:hypothetical protein